MTLFYSYLTIHIQQGKAVVQFELQVPSSKDTLSNAALPKHPTDNQEHEIEESNVVSVEQVGAVVFCHSYYQSLFNWIPCNRILMVCCCQQKSEVEGEGKEAMLHDEALTGDSSEMKQRTTSTEQSLHAEAESNTELSYDSTEDIATSAVTASVESGVTNEKVSSVLIYFDDKLYSD
jgi:hypothetical protein